MKNVKKIKDTQTDCLTYFCYGAKAYTKAIAKYADVYDELTEHQTGVSTSCINKNKLVIVIGIRSLEENINDVEYPDKLRSICVHELSHSVSQYMSNYGFDCDELRSYRLEFLYKETMKFLSKILKDDPNYVSFTTDKF